MIRLLMIRYGPGYYQPAGATLSLSDGEEQSLVAAGRAVYVEPPRIETAVAEAINLSEPAACACSTPTPTPKPIRKRPTKR